MPSITVKIIKDIEVKTLEVQAGVRYWEDAKVDGVEDTDGDLMPCREGDLWKPIIDLETGKILNWTIGKIADVHYKVCDAGTYLLKDANGEVVNEVEGYVPSCLSPKDSGYGDYIIMDIDANGMIQKWKWDAEYFEHNED